MALGRGIDIKAVNFCNYGSLVEMSTSCADVVSEYKFTMSDLSLTRKKVENIF